MIIDITRLLNNIDNYTDVDITYSFKNLSNTDIISLDNIKITGKITKNSLEDVYLDLHVNGICVLPCAMTLEPINVKLDFNIQGLYSELTENSEKCEKTLDILPIIWENILVEIPSKVVSSDKPTKLEGQGWKFITEEEEKINPELEKLKDLLGKEVQ